MPHYHTGSTYGYGGYSRFDPHFTPFIPISPYVPPHNRDMKWLLLLAGLVLLFLLMR